MISWFLIHIYLDPGKSIFKFVVKHFSYYSVLKCVSQTLSTTEWSQKFLANSVHSVMHVLKSELIAWCRETTSSKIRPIYGNPFISGTTGISFKVMRVRSSSIIIQYFFNLPMPRLTLSFCWALVQGRHLRDQRYLLIQAEVEQCLSQW